MNGRRSISQANPVGAVQGEANDTPVSVSSLRRNADEAKGFSIGECEERNLTTARCSHAACSCAATMHELANSLTTMLVNTQVLEWKLPPYSRLKRLVREIERHAQRSGALLKGLLGRFERDEDEQQFCGPVPFLHGTMAAVKAQGLGATDEGPGKLPSQVSSASASGPGFAPEKELTSMCDRCTSTFFPKEER